MNPQIKKEADDYVDLQGKVVTMQISRALALIARRLEQGTDTYTALLDVSEQLAQETKR